MTISERPNQSGVTARILELTSTPATWHRRLWRGGTIQIARELLEESVLAGIPVAAVDDMKRYLGHALSSDPGIADRGRATKAAIGAIKPGITTESYAWVNLREHVDRMEAAYLQTWAAEFDRGNSIDTEGAARRIAAHILDSGYHKNSLYSWLRAARNDARTATFAEFLTEAGERLHRPERAYTFCVPVTTAPRFPITPEAAPGWITATNTVTWKQTYAPEAPPIRHQGAFLLSLTAKDINSAAERARSRIADLENKFHFGHRPLRVAAQMWSKEKGDTFPTQSTNRTLDVHAFENLGRLQDLTVPAYIDSALALVQPVRTGAAHIAVMSGWSAIESLLVGVADDADVIAAQRFSLIIAASAARAEMTALAWAYCRSNDDALAEELRGMTQNIERAKRFQMHLCSGAPTAMRAETDNLALERIRPLLREPQRGVTRIAEILTREFVRLYRKRNLIVHGGRTHSNNLHAITETMSPLIGAGIDRIVHVGLKYEIPPIQLAATAEAKLHYLTPATADHPGNLLDLLEP
ncbi:integrase [Nocardia terpenica]|uniref:Integrase n=1 Tax=Nocardia terpenica TaxID=455432 RepID=A0A291RH87_9NOCA|nr:integrase [Nocardia terpenica]ATL66670.1 integrase [Nocardia terpenica]